MDLAAAVDGNGFLDGQPDDLVPELQRQPVRGEQPGGQQLIDG